MFGPDSKSSVTCSELAEIVNFRDDCHLMDTHPVNKDEMANDLLEMKRLFNKSVVLVETVKKGSFLRSDALKTVSDILELIDPTEAKVLKMRYGINQGAPSTLEAIAKKLSISRERVRQMERTTLRKLHAYVVDGVPPEEILPAEAVRQIRKSQAPSSTSKKRKDNGDSTRQAQ